MTILSLEHVATSPWGVRLLDNISFNLEPGNILGVIGPNGAGKTSLLNLIAGDISLEHGQLRLSDKPLERWHRRDLARHMAYLPQLSLLNFPYTVEEVILLGRSPHDTGTDIDRAILEEVLAVADVAHLAERLYTRLSGGEKQRVQLARVFTQIWQRGSLQGKLLLLDEPTAALDISHQQSTGAAIRDLADRGCAVVIVIHDFNAIAKLADQVIALNDGRQFAYGTPREVFTERLFEQVFAADVVIGEHPYRDQPMIIAR